MNVCDICFCYLIPNSFWIIPVPFTRRRKKNIYRFRGIPYTNNKTNENYMNNTLRLTTIIILRESIQNANSFIFCSLLFQLSFQFIFKRRKKKIATWNSLFFSFLWPWVLQYSLNLGSHFFNINNKQWWKCEKLAKQK